MNVSADRMAWLATRVITSSSRAAPRRGASAMGLLGDIRSAAPGLAGCGPGGC